jgi:hypothetical protein
MSDSELEKTISLHKTTSLKTFATKQAATITRTIFERGHTFAIVYIDKTTILNKNTNFHIRSMVVSPQT